MSSIFSRIPAAFESVVLIAVAASLGACATTADPLSDRAVPTRMRVQELAAASAEGDTLAAKQHFIRGMGFEIRGEYEQAVEYYERALAMVPNQPAVLMATAEAHQKLDDVEAARFYALRAHEAAPHDRVYHQQYADLLLHTGDGAGAIDAYSDLIGRHPEAIDAYLELARVQTHMARFRDAVDTYERVLALLGEDMQIRTEMLHVYIRLADSEGILATLEAMVGAEPFNTSYIRMLAEAYAQNEDPERAITLLHRAVEVDPDDFSLVIKLADLYREVGNDDQANAVLAEASQRNQSVEALLAQASAYYARADVDDASGSTAVQLLHRVLELDPANADASLMLGSIHFQDGAFSEAADHFEVALQDHADEIPVWFQTAAAQLQAGEHSDAAHTAEEGLILFPDQPDLLRLAAYAYMESFENDLAINRFETLLDVLVEDQPDQKEAHAEVLSAMAMMYDRIHDTRTSDSLYLRAIESFPDHSLSLNNYAYSLAERNEQLDTALEFALRAVELDPANPSFLDTLGWVYYQMREFEEAREWIEKSVEAGSTSAAVHEHLGDVLLELGDVEKARASFESARELGGDAGRLGDKLDQVRTR